MGVAATASLMAALVALLAEVVDDVASLFDSGGIDP